MAASGKKKSAKKKSAEKKSSGARSLLVLQLDSDKLKADGLSFTTEV